MKRSKLTAAGWLAMISAVLTVPWFILTVFLADEKGLAPKVTEATLLLIGTTLTVYLLLALQRVLHERYVFHQADRPIGLLIKTNIVTASVAIVGLAFPRLEPAVAMFGYIAVVCLGILQLWFGAMLLRLPDDLGGLRKPYGYLNIFTGVCLISIFLFPVGMVTGAVADVMLGTIFFQVARQEQHSGGTN